MWSLLPKRSVSRIVRGSYNHNNYLYFHINSKHTVSAINNCWHLNLPKFKNNIAIIQDENEITYEELEQRVNNLCYMFHNKYKLHKGDKLMHISNTQINVIEVMLACSKLGVIHLRTFPYATEYQMKMMLNDYKPSLVIVSEQEYMNKSLTDYDKDVIVNTWDDIYPTKEYYNLDYTLTYDDIDNINKLSKQIKSDDIFEIIFSSGTTGNPKGVIWNHLFMDSNATLFWGPNEYIQCNEDDPSKDTHLCLIAQWGGISSSQKWNILKNGSTIILPNKNKLRDEYHWFDLSIKHREISRVVFFGKALTQICKLNKKWDSIKYMVYGGDFVPFSTIKYIKDNILPNAKILHGYGSSECGTITTLDPTIMDRLLMNNEDINLPVGKPMDNDVLLKIDEDDPNKEILVKKYNKNAIMDGYYNNLELTLKTIDKNGYCRTGDCGYFDDDGLLYLKGRLKDIITIDDHTRIIYPSDIENVIAKHPLIDEVAVIGYPNNLIKEYGEFATGESPIAFVTILSTKKQKNWQEIEQEIFTLCTTYLHDFINVKRIFKLDLLPKTNVGKVAKNVLKQRMIDKQYIY